MQDIPRMTPEQQQAIDKVILVARSVKERLNHELDELEAALETVRRTARELPDDHESGHTENRYYFTPHEYRGLR